MKGGMIYGNAASIDGMIERMEEELGCKMHDCGYRRSGESCDSALQT